MQGERGGGRRDQAGAALQVIEPPRGWVGINWGEILRYRELLYFLTWRDIKIRYKQTFLGAAWAVLQPLLNVVVFTVFFGKLAGLEHKTGGIPYPIFVLAGQLPWTFFANSVTSSSNSLIGSANLITKVYFPRLIVPIAAVGAGLVDLAVSFGLLIALMVYYGTALSWQLLLVPLFILGTVLVATGVGTLLSALSVAYRDFRYVVPFMIQLWFFLSPVIYPSSLVGKWGWLLSLNPMTGLIDGLRAAFLAQPLHWPGIGLSLGMAVAFFFFGAAYFRSVERRFADII